MYITWRTVALAAAGAIPAAILESQSVAYLWAAGALVVAIVDAVLAPSPRAVAVRREKIGSVRLTEQIASTLTLWNVRDRTLRGEVRDAWEPSAGAAENRHTFELPGRERRRVSTVLTPTRRGDRNAGQVTLRLLGPLRLAGRQLSVTVPGTVRVLPEFRSRKHLPSRLARLRELDGRSAVQIRGAGSEFDSLREYVIGDDVRSIDWRATGRRADVVVRTWRPERDRHVFILIDSARTAAARIGDTPRIDEFIEAALLLSALASQAGDRVQVVAFDREVRARVAEASGPTLMHLMAERLAPVEPRLVELDWPRAVHAIHEATNQRALVVLLTSLDPGAVNGGMLRAIKPVARKHQVLVASVDDPELNAMIQGRANELDVYGAAAASRFALEREATAARLRGLGAEVVNGGRDELAPAVADAYLALKAAGRL